MDGSTNATNAMDRTTSESPFPGGCPPAQDPEYTILVFLASSAAFPIALLFLLGAWRSVGYLMRICNRKDYDSVSHGKSGGSTPGNGNEEASCGARIKRLSGMLVSGQVLSGKLLVVLEFTAGMVALSVYFRQVSHVYQTSGAAFPTDFCANWYDRVDWQIEFVCNIFLLILFALRFVAANDKLWFMLDVYSLMDYATIPPAFVSLIWNRGWIGLRCLRAFHLLAVPEILQLSDALARNRTAIRLVQLTFQLLAVLLVASGLFHLVETYATLSNPVGEPSLSYWEFVYFSVITLSTVGYGDISPKTNLGRLLCCLFIVSALALFASAVPEVFALLSSRKKYSGPFKPETGSGHIVVTGHITYPSMTKILTEFHHKDWSRDDLHLVFVDFTEPDTEVESFLKRNTTRVTFLQGSLLCLEDLRRAKLQESLACLVVTNKDSADPDRDDSTAIMTVASVKNYSPSTRCVVQILQTKSKNMLINIPTFGVKRGDAAICFQELELALMAQSCLSPGAGTLLLNLMCSPTEGIDLTGADQLVRDYELGCHMEVHLESFSSFFTSMTFCQAAAFCKTRLDLLLIGLFKPMRDNSVPGVQLCPTTLSISPDRIGIFVAPSEKDAARARHYCDNCHKDVVDVSLVVACQCSGKGSRSNPGQHSRHRNPFERLLSITNSSDVAKIDASVILKPPPGWEKTMMAHIQDNATPKNPPKSRFEPIPLDPISGTYSDDRRKRSAYEIVKLDITGNFYWCPGRTFQSALLTKSAAALRPFHKHVLVLVMARPNDPPLGLRELVVPLRSARIPYDELNEVVLIGNPAFIEREWSELYNLPKITVIKGDPLSRADLRAASIRHCSMCVVLSAWAGSSVDPVLDDKAAVLAALNVKAMPFEDFTETVGPGQVKGEVPLTIEIQSAQPDLEEDLFPMSVPIIVELQHQSNVRMLDDSDQDESSGLGNLLLMEPFLSGQTITFSTLDTLLVTSFRNPLAIPIMQMLLYGFKSPVLDNLLAEGVGFVGGADYTEDKVSPYGTRIRLMPVTGGPWRLSKATALSYNVLFEAAAEVGMICLGISRRFKQYAVNESAHSSKRCILTNPIRNFQLRLDDCVYVLSH